MPTATSTPSLCGNGVLDAGEDCDPGSPGVTCQAGSGTGAGFTCNASCQCACPAFVAFTGNTTVGKLDTGWTGQGHDATIVSDGTVTVGVSTCAGSSRPCGVCTLLGPVDNLNDATYPSSPGPSKEINARRCTNNTSILCASDTPCFQQCVGGSNDGAACTTGTQCPSGVCSAAGTCQYAFGTFLPLAAGGVATCVGNQISGTITGTANIETGASATSAKLISIVYSGPTLGEPCPQCVGDGNANDGARGGTCDSGQRSGKACDVNGSSPNTEWGSTSLDCPPLAGGKIASLPIDLSNTTGNKTRTLSAANPQCHATGFNGATSCSGAPCRCECDTCASAAAEPCASNADCTGGAVCGGLRCQGGTNNGAACPTAGATSICPGGSCGRPGLATAPNQCSGGSGDCTGPDNSPSTSPTDKTCLSGPFEQFCGPTETFRSCTSNGDCGFAGDTCSIGRNRECFDNGLVGDVVTAQGVQSTPVNDASNPTLAALFCVGPTSSGAVNAAAGLPGLGKLELPGNANGLP